MKRIVIHEPGGHEALELVQEPDPTPGPGQARVQVQACGVNFADTIVRLGHYEAAKKLYPLTPGFEFAGAVDAAGDGVDAAIIGRRVMGITRFGGYASAICAAPGQLFDWPAGWSAEQAAGFPAVSLTAWWGLFECARVRPGERILVHSAAGGAGLAFLQLAKAFGCPTIGVVGAADKKRASLDFGAEAVIDRSRESLWRRADQLAPDGFDVVFDANGITTPEGGFARLKPGGRLVVYGFAEILPRGREKPGLARLAWNWMRVPRFSPLEMTTHNRGVLGFNVIHLFDRLPIARKAMEQMLGWAAEGRIKPLPWAAFPLDRAAGAHDALESGRTVGKLILKP